MDTILIIRDSVAMCLNKTAEICQPCVNETGTNWQDILIVVAICMTIAIIAISICNRYFKWKDDERDALIKADEEKRKNEEKDRERKQKTDLKDKLLNYYKNRQIKDKKDDKGNVIVYDEDSCNKYVEQLTKMINELK